MINDLLVGIANLAAVLGKATVQSPTSCFVSGVRLCLESAGFYG